MRLTGKQKKAIEIITGKTWNVFNKRALEVYFAYTDRGQRLEVLNEFKQDYEAIMESHHWHSVSVEMWKEDFKRGLLFLDDFLGKNYPKAYIKHAFEIYKSSCGVIPNKYAEEVIKLNVSRF